MTFDLLLLADSRGTAFREFDREQAGRAAEALFDALTAWSTGGTGRAEEAAAPPTDRADDSFHIRLHVGPFHLLACDRRPGQSYAPLQFPDAGSARAAAVRLTALLCPPAGSEQEVYLNTRNFQR